MNLTFQVTVGEKRYTLCYTGRISIDANKTMILVVEYEILSRIVGTELYKFRISECRWPCRAQRWICRKARRSAKAAMVAASRRAVRTCFNGVARLGSPGSLFDNYARILWPRPNATDAGRRWPSSQRPERPTRRLRCPYSCAYLLCACVCVCICVCRARAYIGERTSVYSVRERVGAPLDRGHKS